MGVAHMEIWIGRDGERHGPYKEEDVRQWLASGQVNGQDLGWYEGLADWQPLSVLLPDVTPPPSAPSAVTPPPAAWHHAPTTVALEDHAGFWRRVAAYILDAIVLYIPSQLVMNMMGGAAAKAAMEQAAIAAAGNPHLILAAQQHFYATMWPAMLVNTLIAWAYFAGLESSPWQATVGKLALGIRVTDLHGQRISLPRALGRYLAKFLSVFTLGFGFLMVVWTRRKQGLHDMVVDTLVLNGRASESNARSRGKDSAGSFSA